MNEQIEPLAPKAKEGITKIRDAFNAAMKGEAANPDQTPQETPKPAEAPKPAEPPKAEPKPVPEPVKPTSGKDQEKNFAALRQKAEAAEKRVAELEEQLSKEKEGSAKYNATLEKLAAAEAKQKEADARIAQLDEFRKMYELEQSDEFGQHFKRQMDNAVQDAKDAAPDKTAEIEAILQAPAGQWRDSQMRALINTIEDDYGKQSLILAFSRLKNVERERKAELDKTKINVNYEKLKEVQQARIAEEQRNVEAIREAFWKSLEPEIDSELTDYEESPKLKETLKGILSGKVQAEDLANALKHTAKGYKLGKALSEANKEIETLKQQIAELQASTPSVGGRVRQTGEKKVSMGDRFREAMAKMQ